MDPSMQCKQAFVVDQLKRKIPNAGYRLWIRPLKFRVFERTLEIEHPNLYWMGRVMGRYGDEINSVAEELQLRVVHVYRRKAIK